MHLLLENFLLPLNGMHYAVAQILGTVAVLIALGTYQFNNRITMLRLNMVAAAFYAVSFFLLGAATGGAMNALGSVRCYTFTKVQPNKANVWLLFLFIAAAVALTLLSWQGYVSLLAMGGSILGAIVFWQNNPQQIRTLALIVPPLWFLYDMFVGSYPGMFIEVFNIASILVAKYRFDFRKMLSRPARELR